MPDIAGNIAEIGYLETLASGASPLHRLAPGAKLLTTGLFILAVVSFGRYEVSAMVPFALYPVYLVAAGGLPPRYIARKVLLVAPLAVMVGLFNPFFDTAEMLRLGGAGISGGWVSFVSILLRFSLTVSAALALLALTGVNGVCGALERAGVPRPFVIQLLFLNRYLLALAGEAEAMSRARALRSCGRGAMGLGIFIQLTGHLLLRTLDRAERVYGAMLCRGFNGRIISAAGRGTGVKEAAFVLGWSAFFAVFRAVNIPLLFGGAVTGLLE